MSSLLELQRRFQAYVLGDATAPPESVAGTGAAPAALRLDVYAQAIRLRFLEVLGEDFPGLRALLGESAFERLGRAYAKAHPSAHPSIRWFGRHLPGFVRAEAPWRDSPVLAEMAAFEWARGEMIDAADSAAVGVEEIAAIPPDRWADIRPRFVPALRRLALQWNVPVLWQAVQREENTGTPVRSASAVHWLLWRQGVDIRWRSVEPDEAWALERAIDGANFGELCAGLCDRVGEDAAAYRAATCLKQWATDGLLASV